MREAFFFNIQIQNLQQNHPAQATLSKLLY